MHTADSRNVCLLILKKACTVSFGLYREIVCPVCLPGSVLVWLAHKACGVFPFDHHTTSHAPYQKARCILLPAAVPAWRTARCSLCGHVLQ